MLCYSTIHYMNITLGRWQLQIQGNGNYRSRVLATMDSKCFERKFSCFVLRIHGCFGFESMGALDLNPEPEHQRYNSRAPSSHKSTILTLLHCQYLYKYLSPIFTRNIHTTIRKTLHHHSDDEVDEVYFITILETATTTT